MAVKRMIMVATAGWFFCTLLWSGSDLSARQRTVSFEQGIEHFLKGNLTRADSLFAVSEDSLSTTGSQDKLAYLYSYRASVSRQQNRFGDAERLLRQATDIARQFLPDSHIVRSHIYNNRSYLALEMSEMDIAHTWADSSLKIADKHPEAYGARANAHLAMGYIEDMKGNYSEAAIHYNRGLEAAKEGLEHNDDVSMNATIALNNNLGIVHRLMGRQNEAIRYYEDNQLLIASFYSPTHPEAARNFNNIGAVYFELDDYGESIRYFLRAASLYESSLGHNNPTIAAVYNNVGAAYANLGETGEAIYYFEQSLSIKRAYFGENHLDTAVGYSNLAFFYQTEGDTDLALDYFTRSLDIRRSINGAGRPQLVLPLLQKGKLLMELDEPEEAAADIESAYAIAGQTLGATHPQTVESTILLGQLLEEKGRLADAMNRYHRAIVNAHPGFSDPDSSRNPVDIRSATLPSHLMEALSRKASLFEELHRISGNDDYLEIALNSWMGAIQTLEDIQIHFNSDNSKLIVAKKSVSLFDRAMDAAYNLYATSGSVHHLERAFWIMEKSKSRITHEILTESDARAHSGVPATITESERQLRLEFARVERQLTLAMSDDDQFDRSLVRALQDTLFQIRLQQQAYVDYLEESYPAFYDFKYDRSVARSDDIRRLMSQTGRNMLIFYTGSENSYVMTLSDSLFDLQKLHLTHPLPQAVRQLRASLDASSQMTFKKVAHALYRDLLDPVISRLPSEKWVVIPDSSLHFLPFEMLLSSMPESSNVGRWPWLIKRAEITYAPSATILQRMHRNIAAPGHRLLAVAPFASGRNGPLQSVGQVRGAPLPPLPFSRFETEQISRIMNGSLPVTGTERGTEHVTLLIDGEATPENLLTMGLEKYRYIHFSTHTVIDDDRPEHSGIYLAGGEKRTGILFLNDIFNLGLRADMVVLSGCESGLGRYASGEGVIGFTNAFIQSGVSNLVTSFWKVDDRLTSELMAHFYRELKKGSPKATALRMAKMALIRNPESAHPAAWASFALTGTGH